MSAFLQDRDEIFRATFADLSPNCYMGEGIETYLIKTCRVAVFQVKQPHHFEPLISICKVQIIFYFLLFLLTASKYLGLQSGMHSCTRAFLVISPASLLLSCICCCFPSCFCVLRNKIKVYCNQWTLA